MKYTPQGTPMLIADDLFAKAKALYAELNRRKALETALVALEIYETWLGPRHPATMNCYAFAGLLYYSNQEPETGIRMIREAISYDEERYGHICDPLAEKYMYLAGMPSEDVEHCLSLCHQVADYYQRKKNYPKLVEALTILFYTYQRIENNLPAYAIVKKAVDLFEANLPPGHPDLLKLNVVYADILYKMGEKRESIMVHDRAQKALDEAKSSSDHVNRKPWLTEKPFGIRQRWYHRQIIARIKRYRIPIGYFKKVVRIRFVIHAYRHLIHKAEVRIAVNTRNRSPAGDNPRYVGIRLVVFIQILQVTGGDIL